MIFRPCPQLQQNCKLLATFCKSAIFTIILLEPRRWRTMALSKVKISPVLAKVLQPFQNIHRLTLTLSFIILQTIYGNITSFILIGFLLSALKSVDKKKTYEGLTYGLQINTRPSARVSSPAGIDLNSF